MRKMLVNMILFGTVGVVLGTHDVTYANWPFWVILVCMMGIQFNNSVE
jgi:hypothetical protein